MSLFALLLACAGTPEPAPAPTPVPVVEAAATPAPVPAPEPASPAQAAPVDAAVDPVAAPASPAANTPPAGYQACEERWRLGGCTREHKETCGVRDDGSTQTFPNPCVACERGVTGWKDGACP